MTLTFSSNFKWVWTLGAILPELFVNNFQYCIYKYSIRIIFPPIFEVLSNAIVDVVKFLRSKKGFSFTTLIDITAIDFPAREKRFQIIYHFLSMTDNKRCKIVTSESDQEAVKICLS